MEFECTLPLSIRLRELPSTKSLSGQVSLRVRSPWTRPPPPSPANRARAAVRQLVRALLSPKRTAAPTDRAPTTAAFVMMSLPLADTEKNASAARQSAGPGIIIPESKTDLESPSQPEARLPGPEAEPGGTIT